MYRKVLVPLDGSELAECALSHVKDLVKDGAVREVIVLNVFHIHIHHGGEMGIYLESKMMREGMLEESRQYLASVQSMLASEGIEVKTESLEGNDPADTVSEYAQDNGVDLIVIASHGYTGLKKLMLGSVALGILHESHIPVLLIRPESCRR